MVLASAGVLSFRLPRMVNCALLWLMKEPPSRFYQGSRINLGQVDPFVIGITGSYGKTSTKAILGKILECLEPTFWPPGSINTPMGITVKSKQLEHHFAVIEMAAYGRGSIQRLCKQLLPMLGS